MKAAAKATYGRKGEDVVMKNWAAIDAGAKRTCRSSGSGELEELLKTKVSDMVHATSRCREDVIRIS